MKTNYIVIAVLVILSSGVGFYGGMKYQQSKSQSFAGQLNNRQGGIRNYQQGNSTGTMKNVGINRGGFKPVAGEIISTDDKSITVKLQDDSSKIILINDKTQINKAETVNKSELKVGEKVSVFGSENTDGSVTAQNVQLNPIQMGK
ncbi:MAG: DUF5666 domain-containing protein [Candidatus Roizmanbacteria bacterium]|nr:DUF5666 domain-containing protein [Candidatus Roizmanbacteria bacterium]MCR4313168.1 DUF5666 domain-containing protein [Candidatus Roizmanbacteria bacterium]